MRSEAQLLRIADDLFGERPSGFAIIIPRLHKLPTADGASERPIMVSDDGDITQLASTSAAGVTSLHLFSARMYLPLQVGMFPLATDVRDGQPVAQPKMSIYVQDALVDVSAHPWCEAVTRGCPPSHRITVHLKVGANRGKRIHLRFVAASKINDERKKQPWGETPAFFQAAYDRQLRATPETRDIKKALTELEKSLSSRPRLGWNELRALCGDSRAGHVNIRRGLAHDGETIIAASTWEKLSAAERRFVFGVGIISVMRVDHLPLDPV